MGLFGGGKTKSGQKWSALTLEEKYREIEALFESKDKKDHDRAYQWLKPLAKDQAHAQYLMGRAYEKGWHVNIDSYEAKLWFEKAGNQGHPQAMYRAANNIHTSAPILWYEKLAKLGDPSAQYTCALQYDRGYKWGVEKKVDKQKALYWYQKAAEQGEKDAKVRCAEMYYSGEGTAVNHSRALYWFLEAAKSEQLWQHSKVFYMCGLLYEQGQGIERDIAKAVEYYLKAAERGYQEAQYRCGLLYSMGVGVPQDKEKAIQWLRKATSSHSHQKAEQLLLQLEDGPCAGELRENGILAYQDKDYKKALELLRRSGCAGDPQAQYYCGEIYRRGLGVEESQDDALEWYEKAAKQGIPEAQLWCGKIYATMGHDYSAPYHPDPHRKEKAEYRGISLTWYRAAAEAGLPEGQLMYGNALGDLGRKEEALAWLRRAYYQKKEIEVSNSAFYSIKYLCGAEFLKYL